MLELTTDTAVRAFKRNRLRDMLQECIRIAEHALSGVENGKQREEIGRRLRGYWMALARIDEE